jgi:beta-glucanase (GH16 family)
MATIRVSQWQLASPANEVLAVRRSFFIYITTLAACSATLSSCSTSSETSPCGPTKLKEQSRKPWVCTFADDFSDTTLDPSKWYVMTTLTTGFTSGGECYVDDPQHVNVADGELTLTATKSSGPAPCGPITSAYQSGLVTTKYRFAQTYGRFEIRAKLPRGTGFQPALWMYPQDLAYGDRSGEIDIAEYFGAPDILSPHIHMHDAAGVDQAPGADCHVADAAEGFHTYALEWRPTELKILYDDVPCMTLRNWKPGPPLVAPQPFDQPFSINLQLAMGFGVNAPTAATPFPGELVIDYVHAWK